MRLTALYAGCFLVAGGVLLVVMYLLFERTFPESTTVVRALPPEVVAGDTGEAAVADVLAAQHALREQTLSSLLSRSVVALGCVAVVSAVLGWFVAGRALRPIHRMTETARRVADRSLHERIALRGPADELKELADTFDAMLERLDHAFDGQRRFVGNAAHELRTPLTINRTLVEVALTRPDASEQLRQLGDTLLQVNTRHERLIDGLLLLARSESPAAVTDRIPVDLADVTAHVVERLPVENLAPGRSVAVRCSPRASVPAMLSGDPVLLERLVQNLLENAVRYNRADGWVDVDLYASDQPDGTSVLGDEPDPGSGRQDTGPAARSIHLVVTNTGPPVASYEIPGLFEPFRRAEPRVGASPRDGVDRGAGLGLSIVRSVASAHGGEVAAEPHEGGGLIVRVRLPSDRR